MRFGFDVGCKFGDNGKPALDFGDGLCLFVESFLFGGIHEISGF